MRRRRTGIRRSACGTGEKQALQRYPFSAAKILTHPIHNSCRENGKTLDGSNYYEKVVIKGEGVGGAGAAGGGGTVFSPMPGKITAVMKGEGESVKQGEVVMVLEAMKMEHPIEALADGVVEGLGGKVGDMVQDGGVLFNVKGEGEE